MATNKYYLEDVLIEKVQSGEYNWLDYVNHYSKEYQEAYEDYCLKHNLCISVDTAEQFVHHMDELLEEAIESGDA